MSRRWRTYQALATDLAELLGPDAVQQLLLSFAGRRIYVPRAAGESHPITVAIGADAANTMCEYWHGTEIEFPAPLARRQRILDLKREGRSTGQIAAILMVSERHVREVLADSAESQQLRLI